MIKAKESIFIWPSLLLQGARMYQVNCSTLNNEGVKVTGLDGRCLVDLKLPTIPTLFSVYCPSIC